MKQFYLSKLCCYVLACMFLSSCKATNISRTLTPTSSSTSTYAPTKRLSTKRPSIIPTLTVTPRPTSTMIAEYTNFKYEECGISMDVPIDFMLRLVIVVIYLSIAPITRKFLLSWLELHADKMNFDLLLI